MDADALNRAKRALQLSQSRRLQPAAPPPDQSKLNAVLERARKAVEDRPRAQLVAEAVTATAPEDASAAVTWAASGGGWRCPVCHTDRPSDPCGVLSFRPRHP